MPGMRGLTVLVATADTERFRAALTLAAAQAALGGRVRVYAHEGAVALLRAGADPDAERLARHGLPDRGALIAIALESGVQLIACQTGLAVAGLTHAELPGGVDAGGMVGMLATLGEDRLVAF